MKPEQDDFGYRHERQEYGQRSFDQLTLLLPLLSSIYRDDPTRRQSDGSVWLVPPKTPHQVGRRTEMLDYTVAIGPGLILQTCDPDRTIRYLLSPQKNMITEITHPSLRVPLLSTRRERSLPADSRDCAIHVAPWADFCSDYVYTLLRVAADRGAKVKLDFLAGMDAQQKQSLRQRLQEAGVAQQIMVYAHTEARNRRLIVDLPKVWNEFNLLTLWEDAHEITMKQRHDLVGYEQLPPAREKRWYSTED